MKARILSTFWRGRSGAPATGVLVFLLLSVASCENPANGILPEDCAPTIGGVCQLWRVPGGSPTGLYIPATDGERFYAESPEGLTAYDVDSGEIAWSRHLDIETGPSNYVVRNGRIFTVGMVAIAVRATDGEVLWRYPLNPPETEVPFRERVNASFSESAADEQAFYFGNESQEIYALRVEDGSLLWKAELAPDWPYRGIVRGVSVSGDTLYAGVERYEAENGYIASGMIFALDKNTGRVLWSHQIGSGEDLHFVLDAPRVAEHYLLVADHPGNAYLALDRFTGREVWRYEGNPYYGRADHSPVVRGDTIFAASHDKQVTALELATGAVLWQTEMPGGNVAIALCGNRLLVNYNGLAVLDPGTGVVLGRGYEYDDDADFLSTPFAVTEDNIAFAATGVASYGFYCPEVSP